MPAPHRLDPQRIAQHLPSLFRAARAWTGSREEAKSLSDVHQSPRASAPGPGRRSQLPHAGDAQHAGKPAADGEPAPADGRARRGPPDKRPRSRRPCRRGRERRGLRRDRRAGRRVSRRRSSRSTSPACPIRRPRTCWASPRGPSRAGCSALATAWLAVSASVRHVRHARNRPEPRLLSTSLNRPHPSSPGRAVRRGSHRRS